jgi:hypothetical protein
MRNSKSGPPLKRTPFLNAKTVMRLTYLQSFVLIGDYDDINWLAILTFIILVSFASWIP